jgi:Uri superfamily endonuclease
MAKDPGVYQLHIRLPRSERIQVGKLGMFGFPPGHYVYTGSAMGGLERRLARHQRQEKKLHWHIDYLLVYADIEGITVLPTWERLECSLNAETLARPGARVIVPGFGSSDCRCRTHLVYLAQACQRSERRARCP